MEEVRQLNQVPSKGKRFALVKTKWYAPYVIRGTKWLIKGNILEYEGKQKGDDLEDKIEKAS